MTTTLDDLFEQILRSEERAKARKILLNKVKENIVKYENQLKECHEETQALRGRLILKKQRMCEEEAEETLIGIQEKVLKKQHDGCIEDVNNLKIKLAELQNEREKTRHDFCRGVKEFLAGYGPCGSGDILRRTQAEDEIEKLRIEEESLHEELSYYEKYQSDVEGLNKQKEKLTEKLKELESTNKDLSLKLEYAQAVTLKLEKEHQKVHCIPKTDHEFKRLQLELDHSNKLSIDLTSQCSKMQREIEDLQQQQWQKQLKQQQTKHRPCAALNTMSEPIAATSNIHVASNFKGTNTKRTNTSNSNLVVKNSTEWNISSAAITDLCEDLTEEDFEELASTSQDHNHQNSFDCKSTSQQKDKWQPYQRNKATFYNSLQNGNYKSESWIVK